MKAEWTTRETLDIDQLPLAAELTIEVWNGERWVELAGPGERMDTKDDAKKSIVYLTMGVYSDYGIKDIYIGDVDPRGIIDNVVELHSLGRWATEEQMKNDIEISLDVEKLASLIRKKFEPALLAHGFQKADAIEVWLGE